MAHVLQLYKRRGFDVQIHYEENKKAIWDAAGVQYYGAPGAPNGAAYHHWNYYPGFNRPMPECEHFEAFASRASASYSFPQIGSSAGQSVRPLLFGGFRSFCFRCVSA
jgi:hypothetical protein